MPYNFRIMKKSSTLLTYLFVILMSCVHTRVCAQTQNSTYWAYINQYAEMAVEQMNRHGIPASITLAQGLLESGAGQSMLAVKANNHFGIKVSSGWSGPYVLRNDDKPNEKFRKYSSARESYEDHSKFLKKDRYSKLFSLKVTDYVGWAHGLRECGYATSPTYAQNLIQLIELYHLYDYDRGQKSSSTGYEIAQNSDKKIAQITSQNTQNVVPQPSRPQNTTNPGRPSYSIPALKPGANFYANHPVSENNKNYYIRVQEGDDMYKISEGVGISQRKLRKYNEMTDNMKPAVGSVIYLNSKRSHADRAFKNHPHVVTNGQSMYDIAQMYGIKLKSLYKLNGLSPDYMPKVGDKLRVY